MIAVLYGHDDQVLAEMALPRFMPEIRMARPPKFDHGPYGHDQAPWEQLTLQVDVYLPDMRESTLLQLARQNPDIFVYRKSDR